MQLKRDKEMEFETLKKSYKKQIVIGALAVCVIGGALTFGTTRAKYKLIQDIKLVTGTVNYKVPDMRIVAVNVSEDGENYEIQNDIPTSGYTFNKDKSVCKVATEESGIENAPVDTNITINYHDGVIGFDNISKRNTRCYLYFDKIIKPPELSSEDRIVDLGITVKETTPDFSKTATTNEGVFKAEDGMYGGTSYYWRGAVTNNYVTFAGFCWRIVRINGDGSIRMIYDGSTCHANGASTSESIVKTNIAYNSNYNQSNYVGWTYELEKQRPADNTTATASNAKTQLESWYSSTITGTNADKVADGKYCNDRNAQSGSTWTINGGLFYYAAYKRIITDKKPSLTCDAGDVYSLKVGLITVDEVMYAGGNGNNSNSSYYLYNNRYYWTMSPYMWYSDDNCAGMFYVTSSGDLYNTDVNNINRDLRPVINLTSDVTFSSGDGTQSNPYVVS